MVTHSSIPAWRIPDRGAGWATYSPWGFKETDTIEQLTLIAFLTHFKFYVLKIKLYITCVHKNICI